MATVKATVYESYPHEHHSCMLGELRYASDVNVCVFFHAFRPVERPAGISTPARRSSPRTNVHVLHTFLVLYRHPNRLHGRQEVGQSVCACGLHLSSCFPLHLISFCLSPLQRRSSTLKKTFTLLKDRAICESAQSSSTSAT